jgi:hypothetical protein
VLSVRREAFQLAATLAMVFASQRPRTALSTALPESLAAALDAHADAVLRAKEDAVAEWYEPTVIDPLDIADELEDLQCDTLSTYTALVIAGALDSTRVVRVYRLFVHPSKRVQAVARVLQKRLRDIDTRLEFEWINRTLEAVYEDAVATERADDDDEVFDLRDVHALALRLAQTYGVGQVPPRLVRSLMLVVVEGVSYATQPISVAVERAREAGETELDEVAARRELSSRFSFIVHALEPFAARLPPSVAARVVAVVKEVATRLYLSEKMHAVYFDFIAQLEGATQGRRIKVGGTPATALVKKALKLDGIDSTVKKAPLRSSAKKPKRKAGWDDDDTTTATVANRAGDDSDDDDNVAPRTSERPVRGAAAAAKKKNRTALQSTVDDEDDDGVVANGGESAATSPVAPPPQLAPLPDDDDLVSAADDIDPDDDIDDKLMRPKATAGALSQEPLSQSVDVFGAASAPKASLASTVVPRVMTRRKK